MAVSSRKLLCWGITGAIMLSVGIVLFTVSDVFILSIMEKHYIIVEDSAVYPVWRDIPIPIAFQFWVWNLTNPQEFLNGGPAKMVELGPYVYQETRPKINITHYDNGTVSYMNWKNFEFDPELSIGPDTDRVTTINTPVFVVAHWLRNAPDGIQDIWRLLHEISEAELVLNLTIGELCAGYPDKYLELAQEILGEERVPSTDFGILLLYNDTDDGLWSVFTGETDIKMINEVDNWNGANLLPYWTTEYANALNGTDGTMFHPLVKKEDTLSVFTTYVCRSADLVFERYQEFRKIWLYRFVVPWTVYADPSVVPTNIDFCTPDQTTCPPAGLINGSECLFQAPIYPSMPHFLYGDPSLFEDVWGMSPDRETHQQAVDIDPLSGAAFDGDLRAQINIKIGPSDFIPGANNIRDMYFPLAWLNESASLPEEYSTSYYNYVVIPQYVLFSVMVLLISIGGGILVGLCSFLIWRECKPKHVVIDMGKF